MSAKKKDELRQSAIEQYVRGGAFAEVAHAPISSGSAGGLEAFVGEAGFDDDLPVSSEDALEMAMVLPGNSGMLGDGDEVTADETVEPALTGGTEAAAEPAPAEEAYVLDAWHAVYSDPGQRALALQQQTELKDSVLEVVIGTDDRIQVTNVTGYPWRAICSLAIRARDGSSWIGTAWFVGRRTLITAGHCVYIKDRGGWVSSIDVMPGRNGATKPFGTCTATSFRSVAGWTQRTLRSHDYAAIILPEDCPLGEQLGFFGIANLDDTELRQLTANLSGYPGDKPPGTQWFHAREIAAVTQSFFNYEIDTAGGQSGAPVWRLMNGQRHAVGIHTNGSPAGNSATRINKVVFDNIMAWKAEGD